MHASAHRPGTPPQRSAFPAVPETGLIAPYDGESVFESKAWLKAQNRRLMSFALALIVALLISMVFNVVLFSVRPDPKVVHLTNDLRVIEVDLLTEPYITDNGLTNWSADVVADTFSFDFENWRRRLTSVRHNYFDDAYAGLLKSLKEQSVIETIVSKRLVLNGVLDGVPVITARGVVGGRMSWKIEVPVMLGFGSSRGQEMVDRQVAVLLVQRVSLAEHPNGVRIKQLVLKPRKS